MKIAMLTNNYRPFVGGVPISVERQAQELVKLGHQVTVFAPMYESEDKEQSARFREKVLEEDKRRSARLYGIAHRRKRWITVWCTRAFIRQRYSRCLKRERFDRIHVHHPMFVGPWALWLGKKYGYRLSIHIIRDMKTISITFRTSGLMRRAQL